MNNLYNVIKKPCLTEKGMTLQEMENNYQPVLLLDIRILKILLR